MIRATVDDAAAQVASAAPAPDPDQLRRHLDVLLPLLGAARRHLDDPAAPE